MLGIIFDLDGTLLDTLGDLTDAVNYALSRHGYGERTMAEVRRFVGNGTDRLIRLSVPEDADHSLALATYLDFYPAHSQIKTNPYAGILEALEAVRGKYPVAVVSNKPDAIVKSMCADYFGDIYAHGESSDCPRKPAPDMLRRAMEAIGADSCIYVGDSEVDVVTAKNAGGKCVSVTWGFRDEEELLAAGAEYICRAPSQLPGIIEKIAEEYYGK